MVWPTMDRGRLRNRTEQNAFVVFFQSIGLLISINIHRCPSPLHPLFVLHTVPPSAGFVRQLEGFDLPGDTADPPDHLLLKSKKNM